MKLAAFLTPPSSHHLRLAAQVGYEEIVAPFPASLMTLQKTCGAAESHGLRVSVIERHLPHHDLVHGGPGFEQQLGGVKTLIRHMHACGVGILCYNWMPNDDWQRTTFEAHERGGALVSAFDVSKLNATPVSHPTPAEALWQHLDRFLKEILPFAEDHGVTLALHPDDPPLATLRGQDQIITNYAAFERVLHEHASPANRLCFCQGTFASRGEDIPAGIRRFAGKIAFAHFRDVVGTATDFRETFHDNGKTDMAACIQAYQETDFRGPIRPDHVPTLDGETNENPGYEMLGRLHAVGYMRGLIDGLQRQRC